MITNNSNFRQGVTPLTDWQAAYTSSEMDAIPMPPDLLLVEIFAPTVEGDRTYNFHPTDPFTDSTGRTHLGFSCHDTDEEGPGSFLRYYYSDDSGLTWTESASVLMPDLNDGWSNAVDRRQPLPVKCYERNGVVGFIIDYVSGTGAKRLKVALF